MQTAGLTGSHLSYQQARLWSLQAKDNPCRFLGTLLIQGLLDCKKLESALQRSIARHEILRTTFCFLPELDVPVQTVDEDMIWPFGVVDLEGLDESAQLLQKEEITAFLWEEKVHFGHGSLFGAYLLRFAADKHSLLLRLPALCADRPTFMLLSNELLHAYQSHCTEEQSEEEPLQYADVSAWQDELVRDDSAETKALCAYWDRIDLTGISRQSIPFQEEERQRSRRTWREPDSWMKPLVLRVRLNERTSLSLLEHAEQAGISPASWLFACWCVLLWRLTDETRVLVGVSCDGRGYEGLENAFGLYARAVPVSLSFDRNGSFENIAAFANKALQEATERQSYFRWADRDNQVSPDQTPFFPLGFAYEVWPPSSQVTGLNVYFQQCLGECEPFALKLSALQWDSELRLELLADPCYLNLVTLQNCSQALQALIQATLQHPGQPTRTLPLLLPQKRQDVLRRSEGKQQVLPSLVFHQLFEKQVLHRAANIAIYDENEQLSYQELNARANRLARVLRHLGIGPNVLVGWCAQRGVAALVGLLGILKAGGGYVPLDPESPPERMTMQLQDAQVSLLLTQESLQAHLPAWGGRTLSLEELESAMQEEEETNPPLLSQPDDAMYVIYTSGSTGRPKGVLIRQRSVVNYVYGLKEALNIEAGWHFATVSTLAADLGNTAIFGALAWGGSLQIVEYATLTSQAALARWWSQHPVDVLKIVPSHLSALLEVEDDLAQTLLPRKALVLGGEALPVRLLRRVRKLGGACEIYNHYGPTEATIGIFLRRVEENESLEGETVTIGRPMPNSRGYVLDQHGEMVPEGIIGELYVGGEGEALGYIQQALQTAERFVPDRYSGRKGARLYRTGDMVIGTPGGEFYFVGRRDSQVKIRGYRVELGEIESILKEHEQVRDAVVLSRGEQGLIGYIVKHRGQKVSTEELLVWLSQRVPQYMLPEHWVWMEELPLSKNGKVERGRLPEPGQQEEQAEREMEGNPIRDMIREMWQEVLGKKEIGKGENFFRLGGHSLLATQVIARIRKVLQVEISILTLFEAPTIAGLAQHVECALRGEQQVLPPSLAAAKRPELIPLSFAQQRLWFLDQLEPGSPAYVTFRVHQLRGLLNPAALKYGLEELTRRHEILRTTFQVQEGRPSQVIRPAGTFRLPVVDLSGLVLEEREGLALLLAGQEERQPFSLKDGPLLRVFLIRLDIQEHMLLMAMHHIITDGWSNEIFIRELVAFYSAFVAAKTPSLPPLTIQYADYAVWQRQWLQGEALEKLLTYWKRCMEDAPPVLELPTDRPRPFAPTYHGVNYSFALSSTHRDALKVLNIKENVTLFMSLLAAFQILLSYSSGEEDIVVGTPVANRRQPELENLIGFFINTLVLRTDLAGNPSFRELLQRVRNVCVGAYVHEDLPFEVLVEALHPKRQQGRPPFFQVMFILQNTPVIATTMEGLVVDSVLRANQTSKFDLTLVAFETERGLTMDIEYNVDLFDRSTIEKMARCYQFLLTNVIADPDIRLLSLFSLLEENDENVQLGADLNGNK